MKTVIRKYPKIPRDLAMLEINTALNALKKGYLIK